MKAARLDLLAWALIYAGLLVACLGAFLLRYGDEGSPLGVVLCVAGVAAVLLGTVLIYLRSRVPSK
jgi:hypothetical protein